jgi:hypothetical protein
MTTIVPLNSGEDVAKVLALQKAISDTAESELKVITQASMESDVPAFFKATTGLLEKYARYATFTEFKAMPHLADSEKWGATFGVTTLVGALILLPAQTLLNTTESLKDVYVKYLIDMDSKTQAIKMDKVYAVLTILSENHGIVWAKGEKISLTVVGKRILLHLLDAAKFIDEIVAATTPENSKES